MKKFGLSLVVLSLIAQSALAGKPAKAPAKAALDSSWLQVQSEMNFDYFAKESNDFETNLRLQDMKIKLTAQIAKGLKAVLTTKIDRMLIENGVETDGDVFDVEKFIAEAYIEVRMSEITKTPVAFIIGKHAVAFGQQASRLPMYKDNFLYDLTKQDQMIGVTIALEKEMLAGVLSKAEVSVFENTKGDLKIGDAAGMSVRLTKEFTKQLSAVASAMAIAKDDNYEWNEMDRRVALGFIYKGESGKWRAYAEGVHFEGFAKYPNSKWAAHAGAAAIVGPGEVVVEYAFVENFAHEIAAAYNLPVTKNLIISPEVRHQFKDDGSEDTRIGARAKVIFDSKEKTN